MKKLPTIQETLSPNLIPMIDIMFLLLLFFMLGADMGHRELEDVRLPTSDQAVKDEAEDRITINAHHRTDGACSAYTRRETCRDRSHWNLALKAKDVTDPGELAAALERETAATRHLDPQGRSISDRRVMIRADGAAPYGLAQRAMSVCAEQGIYRIEVGAATTKGR
ncbi:MAG TPA: biopolymer transporter ExbD [Planctomycetota bacterium]|nr:biopolymer transporter ExbD [Planctomycetota bacterium]